MGPRALHGAHRLPAWYDARVNRRALVLCVLSTACASREGPASPEAGPSQAAAEKAAEPDRSGDSPWHWRSDATVTGSPTYLLGVMGQSGVEHCPDGGYDRKWLSVRPTIGRVSVSGPDDELLEPLMDQPVLAVGQPGEPPPREGSSEPPAAGESCLPAQMRSDWQLTPRGMFIERDPAPALQHLRVDAIRSLHELQARKDGDHLVVTLQNPVPLALADVELRTHYEGCFGKPGTRVETTTVGNLGVGAQASARVPMLSTSPGEPDGRREFRAYSVQLVGQGDGVVIDLDVSFADLGALVECPYD
jgi:hypothetical protein